MVGIREIDVSRERILDKLKLNSGNLLQYYYNNGKSKDIVEELVIIILKDLKELGVSI